MNLIEINYSCNVYILVHGIFLKVVAIIYKKMAKHVISFEFFFLAFSAMMPHGVSLKNPKNDKNIGKFCQNLIIHHF